MRAIKRTRSFLLACGLWLRFACLAAGQEALPNQAEFLEEVRNNLRSDGLLLSQYTFTHTRETRYLDKNRKTKRTEKKIWEVFPGADGEETFRRLVAENGKPVSREKLEKQDRKWEQKRKKHNQKKAQKRLQKARREEERAIEDVFRLFEFVLEAREVIDGRPAIRVRFEPRPGYQPRVKEVRQLKKIRGTAWIHEPDHQVVRVEAELLEPISLGWGLLAKLRKGARLEFSRTFVNEEIWLPWQSRVQASARVLLLKGLRLDSVDTYSDFKKFTVDSSVRFAQ